MHVLELFDSGHDTYDIAKRLGMTEDAVWKGLHVQRSERIGKPALFAYVPSWYRRKP